MKNGFFEDRTRGTKGYPLELLRFDVPSAVAMNVIYHWHPEVEITLVEKGGFTITVDGQEFVAEKDDVYLTSPNSLHSISNGIGKDKTYDTMILSLSLINFIENTDIKEKIITPLIENKIYFPPLIKRSSEHGEKIYSLVKEMVELNRQNNTSSHMQTSLRLLELLVYLYDNQLFVHITNQSFEIERIRKVTSFIEENYQKIITLAQLAQLCGLSEKYFCTIFKSATGKTPIEYVNCVRIKSACDKLIETHETVTSIALESGFDNISYFIRQFKKIMGQSPSEWRKTNIKRKRF